MTPAVTNTSPKRVVFVSPVGAAGGGERVLMELARGLQRRNIEVAVCCLRPGAWADGLWGTDVPISVFTPGYRLRQPLKIARAVAWLKRRLKEFQADVMHVNHAAWPWARLASAGMPAKRVWHLHDFPAPMSVTTRLGFRMPPDGAIYTTRRVASGFEKLGARHTDIIAPVTLDPEQVQSQPLDDQVLIDRGLSAGGYLLTVSRWQSHKRLALIPRVLDRLRSQEGFLPLLRWVVVGAARKEEEHAVRDGFLREAEDLDVLSQIDLVEDCTDAQLRSLYKHANRLVHLADTEGFGLVLLESMALGVPFIAADADGPKEVVSRFGAGRLVARGSVEAFVDELRSMWNEQERHQECGLAQQACERFSSDKMVDETHAFYERVLGHG